MQTRQLQPPPPSHGSSLHAHARQRMLMRSASDHFAGCRAAQRRGHLRRRPPPAAGPARSRRPPTQRATRPCPSAAVPPRSAQWPTQRKFAPRWRWPAQCGRSELWMGAPRSHVRGGMEQAGGNGQSVRTGALDVACPRAMRCIVCDVPCSMSQRGRHACDSASTAIEDSCACTTAGRVRAE
jgi:hypothetical protein